MFLFTGHFQTELESVIMSHQIFIISCTSNMGFLQYKAGYMV